jgi:uncharacterized membrane protein YccC
MSKLAERLAATAPPPARPVVRAHPVEVTADASPILRAAWRVLVMLLVAGAAWAALSQLTASFARQVAGL